MKLISLWFAWSVFVAGLGSSGSDEEQPPASNFRSRKYSPARVRQALSEPQADADPELLEPQKHGAVFFENSRTPPTRKKTRGRRPSLYNSSFSTTKGKARQENLLDKGDGRGLFEWDSGQGPGSRRVISSKKTTTTSTKITKSKYDGSPKTTSTFTYTYKSPGSSAGGTTFRNVSTIFTTSGGSSYRNISEGRYDKEIYGTGRGTDDHLRKTYDSGSSIRVGVGEDYLKSTEEDLIYEYEEEGYDAEFAKGPIIGENDRHHPFVIRGFGQAEGHGLRQLNPCDQSSCYPATGNLLIGREDRLSTTSTCGLLEKEKFCIVSHLKHRKKCFWCDSREPFVGNPRYSHRIQNIVYRFDPSTTCMMLRGMTLLEMEKRELILNRVDWRWFMKDDYGQVCEPTRLRLWSRIRSWWQSENGKEDVSIQLDLEAEFHFTHLIITFRTFRPSAMLIERSYDFGKTWKVYRYFAHNCAESYPGIPRGPPVKITDVVCESRYSEVEPSHMGEVIFRVLQPNIKIEDPYSDEVQNLLKITNLRVNFTKLHTLGDQLLDTRPEIKEKYYYAIYDMVVRGSCSCYGHASRCLPLPGVNDRADMVHGRCECTHNTQGLNCEECQDFYNDLPWRPAIGKETNACKRCECNDHATRCHYDLNVYEATGRISGGVCDECQHNTQGRNCEECIPYYYQDQGRSIQDPDICQPCNCDLRGAIDDGICDSKTDVEAGLVAGRCHCRENVDGLKCDRCKAGFWNYSTENPLGCQECTCNLLGTVGNAGCDAYTGKCQCKRNVVGRDCNQCRPQHYGLSDHPDGCQPCSCDHGGALDNDCDIITGQCRCRPHVVGRQCDRPEEGYFVPYLNYLTYEAELARGSELYCEEASLYRYRESVGGNCQVVMREPFRDGRETSWTGIGFMRVFDGSRLEFEVENIESSMEYDLVLKYEPQFRGSWDGMKVRIERPSPVDPAGPCSNTRSFDDTRTVDIADHTREKTLFPPVCFESGKGYKIILEFSRSNAYQDAPSASVLIDSIALIPKANQLPFYSGSLEKENSRQEYQHYRCSEPFYTGQGIPALPETCVEDHLDSIGLYVFKQSYSCQCDATGSRSSLCNPYGGQCDCKDNVEGRRCDRCSPGTYGFGPEGCVPCECSGRGALDNFCDQQTGKCKCRPNTYGRQCNECQPGYWNFPNCQRCECNGHADSCDLRTGFCHDCEDNTTGSSCGICEEGFYGDPRLEVGIACRPCPCPGTIASQHSFASRCSLEPRTKDVICECEEGYAGSRCDVCADNYYGNPEVPGGRCQSCDCSSNVDISRPGNCDPRSGECLQCLFNTAGFHCERCRPDYFGDALSQKCRQCDCNILGTNSTAGPCDHLSGQCPCLPNVIGNDCGKCAPFYWKLASGVGCEECACDSKGSYSKQCNEYDGQCDCKSGFGGRRCDQCEANFYGDPRIECLPCNCNHDGSKTQQCDRETGQCVCVEGIGGFKCDQCARGFTGRSPYCTTCGECFDNWDFIIQQLKERTKALIDSASQIKQRGATGAYKYEFESMEDKLNDVRNILFSANMTSRNLEELDDLIDQLSLELENKEKQIEEFEKGVDDTSQRISLASNALADLRVQAEELKNQAGDLKDKATKLQEANVEGALNLTRMAGQRSRDAQVDVEYTEIIVGESERYRKQTENILIYKADRFNRTITENENALQDLSADLDAMESQIPELNQKVCDRRGDPCDSFCGGAGCGKCGGLSCNDGLVNTALLALKFAEDTETLLKGKEASADDLLRGITLARESSNQAYDLALMVLEASLTAQNSTSEYKASIARLLAEIDEYFSAEAAKPSDITKVAQEILALDIKLRPEQITELAEKITLTIESLTDIDTIIQATRNDLLIASGLKERADRAKFAAEGALDVAQRVVEALNESSEAQMAAEHAISRATDDITATEVYLTQIASETTAAQEQANASRGDVLDLGQRVDQVQAEFKINQRHLDDTTVAVNQASLTAQKALNEAKQLEDKYAEIAEELEFKSKAAEDARIRADVLKRRANKLSSEVAAKLDFLKDLRIAFEENEQKLDMYDTDITSLEIRMEEYHEYILKKATVYTTCTANKEITE